MSEFLKLVESDVTVIVYDDATVKHTFTDDGSETTYRFDTLVEAVAVATATVLHECNMRLHNRAEDVPAMIDKLAAQLREDHADYAAHS